MYVLEGLHPFSVIQIVLVDLKDFTVLVGMQSTFTAVWIDLSWVIYMYMYAGRHF